MSLERFHFRQREWSQETFGSKEVRGPLGPLDHLKKEIIEAINSTTILQSARERHSDSLAIDTLEAEQIEEFVDCYFLIIDAVWRAGFTTEDFENALWEKLKINKDRKWPPLSEQNPNKATEHDRS